MFLRITIICSLAVQLCFGIDLSLCGIEKGCIRQPENCSLQSSSLPCKRIFTYQVDGEWLQMELAAQVNNAASNFYIAVAFSHDQQMGNDSVTECSSISGKSVRGRLSYNMKNENLSIKKSQKVLDEVLSTIDAGFNDGLISCTLRQRIIPTAAVSTETVKALNKPYFIFLATGPTSELGILMHSIIKDDDLYPFISNKPVDLTLFRSNRQIFSDSSQLNTDIIIVDSLIKAHGILMCFAWIIFLSTGIIFGRYMRDHWPNSRIFGLMLWYHCHRSINIIGIALTIAGFVCVFTANDWLWLGPSTDQNSNKRNKWRLIHSLVGLLSCLLAWTQPLIAIFRCKPQLKLRSIFNVIHRTVGVVSWILAATAITIAVRWFKQCFRSPVAALATFIVFLAVFGVTIIVNEIVYYQKWRRRTPIVKPSPSNSDVTPVSAQQIYIIITPYFRKLNNIQSVMLVLCLAVAIGVSVIVCCLIGLVKSNVTASV